MKVAMISDCYAPRVGGIESQVRDLALHLVAAGHKVEILTATNGASGERAGAVEVLDGVVVHRLGTRVPFGLPVNPGGQHLLRARLAEGGFDVAHAHVGVISPFAVDGGDIALELGIPLAVSWHCVLGRWEPVVRRLAHAQRWADRGAALHGVSQMAADQVRVLAPDAEVTVLHNGIEIERWRPRQGWTESPTARRDASLRVVLAMRFTPRKRPLSVIDIVARARALSPVPVTLEICGGGPLLGLVRRVVERRGWSDWVSLPGRVERTRLIEHYGAADVYLASSRYESFGIAALEGRTVGLPVLALRGSGAEDFVVDGVTGLVRDGDDGLVAGLVELAADRALVQRLRSHNEQVPPEQGWDQIVGAAQREYARAGAVPDGATEAETVNHWAVEIEAVRDGEVVERFRLAHGEDPEGALRRRGWSVSGGVEVRQEEATLTVVLHVGPSARDDVREPQPPDAAPAVPVEGGLTAAEVGSATTYQRVAVYALVECERGLLLTELSERTWTPGQWTLPGGGIDVGESALEALHREVWEETGQRISAAEFLGVRTGHWVGRSPGGRVENFHAIRLYYRAYCARPADVVVHDVGGSTASAAWVSRQRLARTPLTASVAPALAQWLD